jgi:class 3 adenylate cyclase
MLQLIWNFFAYLGVGLVSDPTEHKHVVLVNSLAMFISFFMLIISFQMLFLPLPKFIFYISLIYPFLLLYTLRLNANGSIDKARFYLVALSYTYITYVVFLQGNQASAHFYYLIISLGIFFIFPYPKRRIGYYLIIFIFITFCFFELIINLITPIISINEEYAMVRLKSNNYTFAILLMGFSFYIHTIFKKAELSLQLEHEKSNKLLENILPLSIIQKLRENPDSIAEKFEDCTVLFSDIVGFTEMSRKLPPQDLVSLLNEIFSSFDDLAEKYKLEKIKTIGDAYMVVGGLPDKEPFHAEKIADFALDMITAIQLYREKSGYPIQLRIGIHSGAAIAGVIGKKKFIYDLWGESVNTASRMESHGIPGQIQVSESTYNKLKDKFSFMERGILEVKGIGKIKSYFLVQKV